jgi:uridylate kinase
VAQAYQRVLIKLSGDALGGSQGYGIDSKEIERFGNEIKAALKEGMQIGVVVGGGNILRGAEQAALGMDRITGDHMGMLATVINALAIKDKLNAMGLPTLAMSSVPLQGICDTFRRDHAVTALESGKVVVFAGGTGNPLFTTDSAAALRAIEIGADALLKATKVDGIYDKDPKKHSDAKRYESISYHDVMDQGLKVMDMAAIALSMEHDLPIRVFDFTELDQLRLLLNGEPLGTTVGGKHA